MAQTFFLRLLLVGEEDLICEVREGESERLRKRLSKQDYQGFFWFDAIDGRSVIVNLAYLQGARLLWEVAPAPPDGRLNPDEDLKIKLRGKDVLAEAPSEDPEEVYSLFWELELGNDEVIRYEDCDGELFCLVPSEIVWISAPKSVVDEGSRLLQDEDEP